MEKRFSVLVTPEKSAAASVQFPQGDLASVFSRIACFGALGVWWAKLP